MNTTQSSMQEMVLTVIWKAFLITVNEIWFSIWAFDQRLALWFENFMNAIKFFYKDLV